MIFDRSYANFWYYQETITSNESHYVQLRKALDKNSYAYADNKTEALQMVRDGGHILPGLTDDTLLYLAFDMCDIVYYSPDGKVAAYCIFIG